MDKRHFNTAIVVGIIIHIVIIVFYVTSGNPINHFAPSSDASSKESSANLGVALRQNILSHNETLHNGNIGPDSFWKEHTPRVIRPGTSTVERVTDPVPETTTVPAYNIPLIYSGARALLDKNHPQYHPAFPRHLKPVYLLDWIPSPDSDVHFQPISGIDARIYSAYYIDCSPPSVRLFAISYRSYAHLGSVFCHFLDGQKTWMESQKGSLKPMKDHNELEYTDAYIDCPITPELNPVYVSVTRETDLDKSSNQITIQYPGTQRRNFSLCFSPLHSNYNSTFRLIQSIELNRLLGASHFYFYNFSTSPQTDQILRQYEKEDLVTILPWPLPHLETWYYGQIMAINDCIYRNRMTSRYVVVVDTDEFIIPSRHSNWLDLINDVIRSPPMRDDVEIRSEEGPRTCRVLPDTENKNSTHNTTTSPFSFGSFMFKCSYFAERSLEVREQQIIRIKKFEFTDEQKKFFELFISEPMRQLKRNDYFYDYEKRSKLIVRPETVVFHGIHKTEEHIAGYQTAYVNSDTAFVHHYRPDKIKLSNTLDISALRFKDDLYIRLRQAIRKFPTIFPTEILIIGT